MAKQTFETKKNSKLKKILKEIQLNIDMESIDSGDIYGYYIMNRMEPSNAFGLPMIGDFHDEYPDYIALFNHPKDFHRTINTAVSFYIFDDKFDDIDGLYEAIIYKDIELLKYYKYLLTNVKYIIAPDYSMYGNLKESTLIHQLEKEAVVVGWLVLEIQAIVYPNLTYGLRKTFEWCFKNIYVGSNVAISLKGCTSGEDKAICIDAIKYVVDNIQPKAIIVYSTSCDKTTKEILKYAYDNNIPVIIVENALRIQNLRRVK